MAFAAARNRAALPWFAAVACAWSLAQAAQKLPPEADQALSKAEKFLGKTQGDDRLVACIDAEPLLAIVTRAAPEYAYPVGLHAECLFLLEKWEGAIEQYERWLTLVPPEARVGPVLEKVQKTIQRLRVAYMKTGRQLSSLPTPKPKEDPPPEPVPPPAPAPAPKPAVVAKPEVKAPSQEPEPAPKPVVVAKPEVKPPAPEPEPAPVVVAPSAEPAPAVEPPVDLPPPPPPEEPGPPSDRQLALRAGYSPVAGGVGIGGELRLGVFTLAIGTGAYPISAGLGASLPAGPGRAYAEVHALRISTSPFVTRITGRSAAGLTVGYDLRVVPFLSVKLGVGAGYEQLLGQPWRLAFDASIGPVFDL